MIDDREIQLVTVTTDWGGATTKEEIPAALADDFAEVQRGVPGVQSVHVTTTAKATPERRVRIEYDDLGRVVGWVRS